MAKELTCQADSFRVRTDTDDQLVAHAQLHAKEVHQRDLTREQVLQMAKTVPEAIA